MGTGHVREVTHLEHRRKSPQIQNSVAIPTPGPLIQGWRAGSGQVQGAPDSCGREAGSVERPEAGGGGCDPSHIHCEPNEPGTFLSFFFLLEKLLKYSSQTEKEEKTIFEHAIRTNVCSFLPRITKVINIHFQNIQFWKTK